MSWQKATGSTHHSKSPQFASICQDTIMLDTPALGAQEKGPWQEAL